VLFLNEDAFSVDKKNCTRPDQKKKKKIYIYIYPINDKKSLKDSEYVISNRRGILSVS